MAENPLSVDLDALRKGGVNIVQLAEYIRILKTKLESAQHQYPKPGGTGDEVAEAFDKVYDPGAEASLEFLVRLLTLLGLDGGAVIDVRSLLENTGQDAADVSGGGRKG